MPRKGRRDFLCLDCKVDTGKINEYYALIDEVWLSIHPSKKGMLCIGCAETRLGRKLTEQDFVDCLMNDHKFYGNQKSARYMNRLLNK